MCKFPYNGLERSLSCGNCVLEFYFAKRYSNVKEMHTRKGNGGANSVGNCGLFGARVKTRRGLSVG